MQITTTNDVKQYNLTVGRSLPEWLDERKRRRLLQKDVELRRRICLLQDFEMPSVSNNIVLTQDQDYILATGTYKPRIRCYDVNQMGMKFERCYDSEPVAIRVLSDDYSKIVSLHCDRFVEIHAQYGRYYRLRIPKFGRDMSYHPDTCDVFFVGDGAQVHRLNLEQGRFLNPLTTDCHTGLNACALNEMHHLLLFGGVDARLEAWDPRTRSRVGILDTALVAVGEDEVESLPQITSLAFRDALNFGVGTSNGKILLYDLRSSKPLLVKDHMYGIPIKKLAFHSTLDQVVSLDSKVVKVWDRLTGKPYTSIESSVQLNDLAFHQGSGLFFLTNEQPKMQVHYIPSMGPSPRWCSFLDNITEEMEESQVSAVYDDYKFVTKEEIADLGLDHLIGTNLMRAYMHGFFMDARLYRKAKSLAQPFTLDKYVHDKIQSKLEEGRAKRVKIKSSLPTVNKDLFLKLKDQESKQKKSQANLLQDDRFKAIFMDDRFEVDTNEDAYRLLAPALSRLDETKKKLLEKQFEQVVSESDDADGSDHDDDDDFLSSEEDSDSSEEKEKQYKKDMKEVHRQLRRERERKRSEPAFYQLKDGGEEFLTRDAMGKTIKDRHKSLSERLQEEGDVATIRGDGHQMVFKAKRSKRQLDAAEAAKRHRQERLAVRRSASSLHKKKVAPKFYKGRRVV